MQKKLFLFTLIILLAACQRFDAADIPQPLETDTVESSAAAPRGTPTTQPLVYTPRPTPTPLYEGFLPHIYCGEDLQLEGIFATGNALTLYKYNGLEYFNSKRFIKGILYGEVLATSEFKGSNLRLPHNDLTADCICYVGYHQGDEFVGIELSIDELLNERRHTEDFEGSLLLETREQQVELEWLTYRISTSSKKDCVLYRILKNPYPCREDCEKKSQESGCSCFCANFLYYDENCILTEINPDCMCVCREE